MTLSVAAYSETVTASAGALRDREVLKKNDVAFAPKQPFRADVALRAAVVPAVDGGVRRREDDLVGTVDVGPLRDLIGAATT